MTNSNRFETGRRAFLESAAVALAGAVAKGQNASDAKPIRIGVVGPAPAGITI